MKPGPELPKWPNPASSLKFRVLSQKGQGMRIMRIILVEKIILRMARMMLAMKVAKTYLEKSSKFRLFYVKLLKELQDYNYTHTRLFFLEYELLNTYT